MRRTVADLPMPLSGETRTCGTCNREIPVEVWSEARQDHPLILSGPMSFDHVGRVDEDNYVTFKVHQPFITVWCSEYDRTIAVLMPTFEEKP